MEANEEQEQPKKLNNSMGGSGGSDPTAGLVGGIALTVGILGAAGCGIGIAEATKTVERFVWISPFALSLILAALGGIGIGVGQIQNALQREAKDK